MSMSRTKVSTRLTLSCNLTSQIPLKEAAHQVGHDAIYG